MKNTVTEYDAITGETTTREATAAEIARTKQINDETAIYLANQKAAKEARAAAKTSAQIKLAALGLTEEEVAAIVGN